jgi:hydrogenase maturation protein HypF
MSRLMVGDITSRSRHNTPRVEDIQSPTPHRRRLRVTGQVQGVGFRPFVYRLATELGLCGHVFNDGAGVVIEVEGSPEQLDTFIERVQRERPALSQINTIRIETDLTAEGTDDFVIRRSDSRRQATAAVTADAAVCPDCLEELLASADRRHHYALINCTNCGPRFSIVRDVPYDRPNTTMAAFEMCDACAAEYSDPTDRRFHAQPTACHDCGPQLALVSPDGGPIAGDAITETLLRLHRGGVVAIKGIGGFHLAARASDDQAVARLRASKKRDAKPFALMVRDVAAARELVALSAAAVTVMQSPACPIVLAPRTADDRVSSAIAPGTHRLGVMLPYTPIQHLLFHEGGDALGPLVMTSANISDEPLVMDNDDALRRLADLCDAILWHDRPIERCVDDSIVIDFADGSPLPVRRARGYVPTELTLPIASTDGLCVGGELKNTVTVVRDGRAIVSQHIGDLKHPLAYQHFERAIDDMVRLFHASPRWIACDLHPQYMSTTITDRLAERFDAPVVEVQHHHAHAAALLAEHGRTDTILAIVCDGVGYGTDGTSWGGELLRADLHRFERLTHLRPLHLPGGDAAAKDARRCALALVYQALGDAMVDSPEVERLYPADDERRMLCSMIQRNINCVASSAAGRYFDGIAALLGVRTTNRFEAEAAMALEAAAFSQPDETTPERLFTIGSTIDLSALTLRLLDGSLESDQAAALFHDQLAWAWAEAVESAAAEQGIRTIGLSGGVFCNERLTMALTSRLQLRGFEVLRHRVVPANDGGLSFGQAAVAAARMSVSRKERA